ncbi:hypothetical protein BC829DRAFT_431733 [Chytridium lagenaria]|nr:hypothetical protein BC829DRAFT_431733 [Chytridium lagenaria]
MPYPSTSVILAATAALLLTSSSTVNAQNTTSTRPPQPSRPIPTKLLLQRLSTFLTRTTFVFLLPAVWLLPTVPQYIALSWDDKWDWEPNISIGESEGSAVSKCVGNALLPDTLPLDKQFILSAHAVKTPNHIQVTGRINTIGMEISGRGGGGQYDDASWGIEPFSHCLNYDRYVEIVGGDLYCVRCCNYPAGTDLINVVDQDRTSPCFAGFDTAGCHVVVPGDYGPGFTYTEQADLPVNASNLGFQFPASIFTIPPNTTATTTTLAPTDLPSTATGAGPTSTFVQQVTTAATTTASVRSGAEKVGVMGILGVVAMIVALF